jgi:hypothetical protein
LKLSSSPFCIGYLCDGVSFYAQAGPDHDPPICASLSSREEGTCHYAQPLAEIGSRELFAQADIKPLSS